MSKRMMAMVLVVLLGVLQPAFAPAVLAQGPQEGIKVHGHWVIDVRNADGTLSSHAEFENALMPQGALALARLLARTATNPEWIVSLETAQGEPFGRNAFNGSVNSASLYEAGALGPGADGLSYFRTLTIAQEQPTLVLKGTATASGVGSINRVSTYLQVNNQSGPVFSGTTLPTPVALAAGQIVQVSVTFSFS